MKKYDRRWAMPCADSADELTELWRFVRYHLGSQVTPDERQALDHASDEEIIGFLLRVLFRNGELELDAGTRAALEAGWMH
jgi:hypothetical protein